MAYIKTMEEDLAQNNIKSAQMIPFGKNVSMMFEDEIRKSYEKDCLDV